MPKSPVVAICRQGVGVQSISRDGAGDADGVLDGFFVCNLAGYDGMC